MCVLLGYGADAVCPYLVFETMRTLRAEGVLPGTLSDKDIYKVEFSTVYIWKFVVCGFT